MEHTQSNNDRSTAGRGGSKSALAMDDADDETLPIQEFKGQIVSMLKENQIIICISETGSGKTTQIPQYCLDGGLLPNGGNLIVGVTQPRRVAAITVAERVSWERRCTIGHEVGYSVRFDDNTSSRTRIKYMTDGILVRECLYDRNLSKYGVIMLDEAHERSLNTDILFGLIKEVCSRRSDLRVIVTSATLSEEKFSRYFNGCPVLHIPGRVFPVDIYHSKVKQIVTTSGPATNAYIESAASLAIKIHLTEEAGHILVFLTGQDEIDSCCEMIRAKVAAEPVMQDRELLVMPLHSTLSGEAQKRVFQRTEHSSRFFARKCIVATNIAETSITVPFVRYVVDAGYVKQKTYNPDRHMESLVVVPISQVAAQQRAGRAGRTAPGKCYRLYSSDCYGNMMDETVPEILRTNLTNTILYLKVLGIHDVLAFDFLDMPDESQMVEALVLLNMLGAIDSKGTVTDIGRTMSKFPLEPSLARAIVAASEKNYNCVYEVASICALVSSESIWFSPPRRGRQQGTQQQDDLLRRVDERHQLLYHPSGDHLTYLVVLDTWEAQGSASRAWCEENFINFRAMSTARRIRDQLCSDAKGAGMSVNIPPKSFNAYPYRISKSLEEKIGKALLHGLYMTCARHCGMSAHGSSSSSHQPSQSRDSVLYRTLPLLKDNEMVLAHAHTSSTMTAAAALTAASISPFVLYQELVCIAGKLMIRHVSRADPVLLMELQGAWVEPKYPKVLSGRVPPMSAAGDGYIDGSSDSSVRIEDSEVAVKREALENERKRELAVSAAAAVDDAKARYLARKKQRN